MRKGIDFGNAATNCFDFEQALKAAGCDVLVDQKGGKTLRVVPSFLMDPCQSGITPLRTLTIWTNGVNAPGTPAALANGTATFLPQGAFTNIPDGNNTGVTNAQGLLRLNAAQARAVSASNTAQSVTVGLENLGTLLSISSVASGGTATLVVAGSTDNVNYITCDSIAAALTNQVSYSGVSRVLNGTAGSPSAFSPLGFRFIKVTAGAAGVGFTTQLDIGAK